MEVWAIASINKPSSNSEWTKPQILLSNDVFDVFYPKVETCEY